MSRRWPPRHVHDDQQPASAEMSRLLVMGFLIAALLGALTGLAWVGWNVLKNVFAG